MSNRARPWTRRLRQAAAGLLAAVGLGLAGAALASDLPGRVGRLADTDGTVWFRDADGPEWSAATRNRPLTTGDRVATEEGGRATVHIGSSTLRLGADTELEVVVIDDEQVRLMLQRGSLALRVRSDTIAREVELLTEDGRLRPLRAGHYRLDRHHDTTFAEAWEGVLRFEGRDSTLDVAAGQRAEFWLDRGATHYTWSTRSGDRFGDWALADDREEQRYAANANVPQEMTGAWELDRHGRWDHHPEYGRLWYPHRVAPGWAPYRVGHWAWVQPWGWTWIDDAPWGFAPFHYGRWVHWRGHWAWAPGSYVGRPAYAPALVAWVGGSGVSVGISIGGPTIGWVPLAPLEAYVPHYRYSPRYWQRINPGRIHERHPRPVRTGPIMYTNQGVPGGITVVPSQVLRERQPVARAVLQTPVAPRTALREASPPPPAPRVVVAEPGGARAQRPGNGVGRPALQRDDPPVRALPVPAVRDLRERPQPQRVERAERGGQPDRPDGLERFPRPQGADLPARPQGAELLARPQGAELPGRPERIERPGRNERSERIDRSERAGDDRAPAVTPVRPPALREGPPAALPAVPRPAPVVRPVPAAPDARPAPPPMVRERAEGRVPPGRGRDAGPRENPRERQSNR